MCPIKRGAIRSVDDFYFAERKLKCPLMKDAGVIWPWRVSRSRSPPKLHHLKMNSSAWLCAAAATRRRIHSVGSRTMLTSCLLCSEKALFSNSNSRQRAEESRQRGYEKHSRRSKHCGVICYNWICRGERRRRWRRQSVPPRRPHPRSSFSQFCVFLINSFFILLNSLISTALLLLLSG